MWQSLVEDPITRVHSESVVSFLLDFFERLIRGKGNNDDIASAFLENRSVTGGVGGIPLLFGQLYKETREQKAIDLAYETIRKLIPLYNTDCQPHLYGGLAGLGLVMELIRLLMREDERGASLETALQPLDEVFSHLVKTPDWQCDHELGGGLVGIGVYLISRLPREIPTEGLHALVERLNCLGERVDGGFTWRKPTTSLTLEERTLFPSGFYSLSFLHGIPGIVAFLSRLSLESEFETKGKALLHQAVSCYFCFAVSGCLPESIE